MTSHHVLLVINVSAGDVEIVSDLLWSYGAQAVEERRLGSRVDLVTDFGENPLTQWDVIEQTEREAGRATSDDWWVRTLDVPVGVADTWRDHVGPTSVAGLRIVPEWTSEAPGLRDILIDPEGSFGMGDHPTTRATLELAMACDGSSVLDLGCGSGVLSVALAKFRGVRCLAVDISASAIETTKRNARRNGVESLIVVEHGDVRVVRGTYDLVLANILAPVLMADAEIIASRVTIAGSLILSGFMANRVNDVRDTYAELGLEAVRSHQIDGWYALQLERVS